MLEKTAVGPVTLYRTGRSMDGYVPYHVHSFLLGDVLIDTGCTWVRSELLSALEGETITKIINTHHHEDHIGNNRAVQKKFGAEVYAPLLSLPFLKCPGDLKLLPYQLLTWEYPEPCFGLPLGDRVRAREYTLEVIPTPGHCSAHVCFYEPHQKWLFSGDTFCGKGFKYLRADEDYNMILESLQKLLALPIDTIFCSLVGAVPDGHSALAAKADFMRTLRDSVLELHQQGFSPKDIRLRVLGEEIGMTQITDGHYSKQNTVDSILGILK